MNDYAKRNRNMVEFTPEKSKKIALARLDLLNQWKEFRKKSDNKLQADYDFVNLHNTSNSHLFEILGKISRGTLHRWKNILNGTEDYTKLIPQYKYAKVDEYRTCLTDEEIKIFMGLLLHPNRLCIGKAIALTKYKLKEQGQSYIPADITFRKYANWFKKNNYDKWVLARDGEKALLDKVEPYIKRDASLLEVGDILVADGHKLAFNVINPFTGKASRATLVGFLDWKSTALVGYEIMLEENTQCIASALRNSIINLDMIPQIVYQDNGRAFRAKYFTDDKGFTELGFQGLYSKLGIETVFARPYNARAKVIERFFREFQEEFEKMMPSYIGRSIEDKPAWMKRGEKLHLAMHQQETKNHIPTVQEVIKYINCWLEFHNKKPCPNDRSKSIQEMLDSVQKQNININILNTLMMKTECRTITKHGITFLNMHYRSEAILGLREQVFIRYSLFDLSKIFVYSSKGEFLCVAKRVQKVHPMANVLGTVKDMEEYKQQYKKQQQIKNRLVKQIKKNFTSDELQVLEIEGVNEELALSEPTQKILSKPKRERVKTPREQQMNRPLFNTNYEKYEWLMKNGCTNAEDRTWLTQYIRSDEYFNLYEN